MTRFDGGLDHVANSKGSPQGPAAHHRLYDPANSPPSITIRHCLLRHAASAGLVFIYGTLQIWMAVEWVDSESTVYLLEVITRSITIGKRKKKKGTESRTMTKIGTRTDDWIALIVGVRLLRRGGGDIVEDQLRNIGSKMAHDGLASRVTESGSSGRGGMEEQS
ncbi:unnamed protein product [Nezara viridula]|uniref:Uncharacterized protein n=1 Tax=Nezara viridula TaxID=85310 RepID=A0A9P0H383_NEZVI|nr:unnamed protein product [Nezara viridula]